MALQLAKGGDFDAALAHYKVVFDKEPTVAANWFTAVLLPFDRAGKSARLVELLNTVDSKALPPGSSVARLMEKRPDRPQDERASQDTVPQALGCFPGSPPLAGQHCRPTGNLADARNVRLRVRRHPAWSPCRACVRRVLSFSVCLRASGGVNAPPGARGSIAPAVLRLIDLAEERGRLDQLLDRIETARTKVPAWTVADAIKAMVLCRTGRFDEARSVGGRAIESVQKDKSYGIATYKILIYWVLGLELEKYPATRGLALTAFEASLLDPYAVLQFSLLCAAEWVPAREIVPLAVRIGRRDEARRRVLGCVRNNWSLPGYPEATNQAARVVGLDVIGTSLVELGFAADAAALFREAQVLCGRMDTSVVPALFPRLPEMPRQIEDHLNAAIDGMGTSELAGVASRVIARAGQEQTGPVVDLMVLVHPRSLDKAMVRSLFADSLAACDDSTRAARERPIESLRQAHPDDLSVAIAARSGAGGDDGGRAQGAIEQLAGLIEKTPLEALADGVRANARERAQAAGQIPLWLVARACRTQANASAKMRAHAESFAARALEAARRQEDRVWLLAMMREQGQLAFERSDRSGAAAVWSRMLDLVVTPPQVRARRTAAGAGDAPGNASLEIRARKNQNHRTRWTMTAAEVIGENINMLATFA